MDEHLLGPGLQLSQLLAQGGVAFKSLGQLSILGLRHSLCCRSVALRLLLQILFTSKTSKISFHKRIGLTKCAPQSSSKIAHGMLAIVD